MARGKASKLSRRRFMELAGLSGLSLYTVASCAQEPRKKKATAPPPGTAEPIAKPAAQPRWKPFPVIEAKGSPFDIGHSVGRLTREQITQGIAARGSWFNDLKAFATAQRKTRIDKFVAATGSHHPDILKEIEGIAKGAGLPFDDIFILNIQSELGALKESQGTHCDACSTLHVRHDNRLLLAHNEDGHDAYRTQMVILRASPTDAPGYCALLYPGLIAGNVPAANDAGIVMTTNFIGTKEVQIGVPRYVLGRAVLGARTLDEAVAVATNKETAYSFHLNLGSTKEKRLLAVDVSPSANDVVETDGIFLQTNHFVLPQTRDIEQLYNKPGGSSDSRYRTLKKAIARLSGPADATADKLISMLSSHDAVEQPYSPCRHPIPTSEGRTLATAAFDLTAGTFDLYQGNPCENRKRRIPGP